MKITKEEVIKLALLARLKVTEEEVEQYSTQLTDILNYSEQVQNFSGLKFKSEEEKAIQIIDSKMMRDDLVVEQTQDVLDHLMSAIPQKHGKFVKSPKAL